MDSKVEVDTSGFDAEEQAPSSLNDSLTITISTISEEPGPRTQRRYRRSAHTAAEPHRQEQRSSSSIHAGSTTTTFDVDAFAEAMSTALSRQLHQFQETMIQALKANPSKQVQSPTQSYEFPRQMTTPLPKFSTHSRMTSRAFRPTESEAKTPVANSFHFPGVACRNHDDLWNTSEK